MSNDLDCHAPKPWLRLVTREFSRTPPEFGWSVLRRLEAASRSSFIHPRARLLGAKSIHVGHHVQVHAGATVAARGAPVTSVKLGRYVIIRENAYVDSHGGTIELCEGVFIGQNAVIYGQGGVTVGRNTLLSPGVTVITAEHGIESEELPIKFQPEQFAPVEIGNDCWLGANAVVLAGVRIGAGAIVGAGAVVTRDLPVRVIAHGVPARVVRERGVAKMSEI